MHKIMANQKSLKFISVLLHAVTDEMTQKVRQMFENL